MFGGSSSLKFFKRLNVYKNSTNTVSFNPVLQEAWSYNWKFLSKVEGMLVFNDYVWSVTTSCHQSAVSALLRELGLKYIRVDLGSERPERRTKETVKKLYKNMFSLEIEIQTSKRIDTYAYQNKVNRLKNLQENILKIESISKKFKVSQKDQKQILKECTDKYFETLHNEESEKCYKYLVLQAAGSQQDEIKL